MFNFLHRPIRVIDASLGNNFLERFLLGPQAVFEQIQAKIDDLPDLLNPAKIRSDLLVYLKDHVGFTKELDNITKDLSENDLRKLISLATALWKQKGTEPGYENIVRLFTGKAVRIFNWFDFRLIVGEKAFGEEQLGEDSWLISVPGVEGSSDIINNVVCLLTFEGNLKDRSLSSNHGVANGSIAFFNTPSSGFPQGSKKYIRLQGGHVVVSNSAVYDFSGDVTIEMFIRTTVSQAARTIFHKVDLSGRGITVTVDTMLNTISFYLSDGVNTVADTLSPSASIGDGQLRHLALVVNRDLGARLYYGGTESTSIAALGPLGDLTSGASILVGSSGGLGSHLEADLDNFRLALNAAYDVAQTSLTPPLSGFIEYQEEALDEYFSDIRIVDEGDLNKTLMLRILNLMRPASERLNVIFIRFFDDFSAGSGRFVTLAGTSRINTETELEIDPVSMVATDVLNDHEFQDIVLQVKANDTDTAGGQFSVLFFVQGPLDFYEFRSDTVAKVLSLHKTVAGVSTQIGADVPVDIVATATYIYTVQTSFNGLSGNTFIKTYLDSNRIHTVVDGSFIKGRFGMKTGLNTTMQVGEVEMMQLPVDVGQIKPGFSL